MEANNSNNNYLQYKNSLNVFLYKFCFFGIVMNFFLYLLPSLIISILLYTMFLVFFIINFVRIYDKKLFTFFTQLMVSFIIFLSILTWLFSYVLNEFILGNSLVDVITNFMFADLSRFFLATAYAFFFATGMLFCSKIIPDRILLEANLKFDFTGFEFIQIKIFYLILICLVIELYFFYSGLLGWQGQPFILKEMGSSEADKVTWFTTVYSLVTIFHLVLNIMFIKTIKNARQFIPIIFIIASFVVCLFFFSIYSNRRSVVIFFVTLFILYSLLSNIKFKFVPTVFVLVITITVIHQFTLYMNTIRDADFFQIEEGTGIQEVLEKTGTQYIAQVDVRGLALEKLKYNLSFRALQNTLLASYFYYNSLKKNEYLYGKAIARSIGSVIPEKIFPTKRQRRSKGELVASVTNLPLLGGDLGDSKIFYSYLDFGLFGLLIYPLIINLCFFFYYFLINLKWINKGSMLFILAFIIPILTIDSTEGALDTILVNTRNLAIFIFFINYLLKNTIEKKL